MTYEPSTYGYGRAPVSLGPCECGGWLNTATGLWFHQKGCRHKPDGGYEEK